MKKRYAFWEYDKYPFVLTGEVVGRADEQGRVQVKGYDGLRFMPLKIIVGEEGRRISEALNYLRELHREALAEVRRDFYARALLVAPFLRNCKHSSAYREEKKRRHGVQYGKRKQKIEREKEAA